MGLWKRLQRLHGIEAIISLARHFWDAVGPLGQWCGVLGIMIGEAIGLILGVPLWIHWLLGSGFVLIALAIWDLRMRRREMNTSELSAKAT